MLVRCCWLSVREAERAVTSGASRISREPILDTTASCVRGEGAAHAQTGRTHSTTRARSVLPERVCTGISATALGGHGSTTSAGFVITGRLLFGAGMALLFGSALRLRGGEGGALSVISQALEHGCLKRARNHQPTPNHQRKPWGMYVPGGRAAPTGQRGRVRAFRRQDGRCARMPPAATTCQRSLAVVERRRSRSPQVYGVAVCGYVDRQQSEHRRTTDVPGHVLYAHI